MSLHNFRTKRVPDARRTSTGPERLESRTLLSVAIDLSLQGAVWAAPATKAASATIVPFRVDAIRTLGPAVDPTRIDGVGSVSAGGTAGRIDGVSPPAPAAASGDVLTFTEVDVAGVFARPFERDPAEVTADKGVYKVPEKPGTAGEVEAIDLTGFEVFKDVTFTFAGGAIRAGLPTAEGLVSVNIVVKNLPPGVVRPSMVRTGTGNFFARLESLTAVPPTKPAETPTPPTGNGPLGLDGGQSVGTPTSPPPPVATPATPTAPTPVPAAPGSRPGGGGKSGGGEPEVPPQVVAKSSSIADRMSEGSSSYTVVLEGRSSGRLGIAGDVRIIGFSGQAASAAAGGPAVASPASEQAAPTTALMPSVPGGAAGESSAAEMSQFLLMAAGTQLSALSAAAQRLFGADPTAEAVGTAAGAPEIDYDALRGAAPFVSLGLSPWHAAGRPVDQTDGTWNTIAGVSFVIAVGGYWYCKEYSARRRQAQLASSAFVPTSRNTEPLYRRSGSELIGRISRLWRDELED